LENIPRKNYYIENEARKVWLEKTEVEKDLRVMVSSDGKNSKLETVVSKANRTLGRIRNSLNSLILNYSRYYIQPS
jgi:hypothetical protein